MKTLLDTEEHQVSGQQETRKLTIEANGKAFKELISGIYSDKAYAIARETMANCVDSHVQAGCPDRPFDLKVPTAFEPDFMIRDYGVSMDHDTVMDLYSTLFRSTKDDPNSDQSNKFVGKFGLGSKSPFSYTDAFQLTAYLDGFYRVYDVYFNGGVPQISLFHNGDTDEENGIMITFPVDPKDCDDFERAIIRASEGLDVKPNFTGKRLAMINRIAVREGAGWKLLKDTSTGRAEARQGTVIYPLNPLSVIDLPERMRDLFSLPLRLEFEIGELDVTTSREALSYDEQTSANIIAALQKFLDDVQTECTDQIAEATSYHDFCQKMWAMTSSYKGPLWTGMGLANTATYKGRKLRDTFRLRMASVKTGEIEVEDTFIPGKKHTQVVTSPRYGSLELMNITEQARTSVTVMPHFKSNKHGTGLLHITTSVKKMILVLEDLSVRPRYTKPRMAAIRRRLAQRADVKDAVVLWGTHYGDLEFALKRLKAACGRMPIEIINILDEPYQKPPIGPTGAITADFKVLYRDREWEPSTHYAFKDLDLTNAYYVPLYSGETEGNSSLTPRRIADIRKMICDAGADDLPVIGVPKTKRSHINLYPGWIEFIPTAIDILTDKLNEEALTANFISQRMNDSEEKRQMDRLKKLFNGKLFDTLIEGTSIQTMFEYFDYMETWKELTDPQQGKLLTNLGILRAADSDIQCKAMETAKEVLAEWDILCKQVSTDFGLLKYMTIPLVHTKGESKIIDLDVERDRRLKALPFYSWLKKAIQQKKEKMAQN